MTMDGIQEAALRFIQGDPEIARALAALDALAQADDAGAGYFDAGHDALCARIGDRLLTLIAEA